MVCDLSNHKFQSNKKYFTISIYTLVVILIGSLIIKTVFSWEGTSLLIRKYVSALSPFFIGFFIAYILNPIVKSIDKKIFLKVFHLKSKKLRGVLSIFTAYLLALGFIVITFLFLIPQLGKSITDLAQKIPDWYEQVAAFLNNLENQYPTVNFDYLNSLVNDSLSKVLDFSNITNVLSLIVPTVFSTSVSVIKWILNIIIATIISCYMLIDKKTLNTACKRLLYAILCKKRADYFLETAKKCNNIFSGFISGKTIDSIIIGILCFVAMTILQLPYAMLISVIVGITNMIPYFGPFIGCVPGAIIILLISPIKLIIYLLLIFVLQQFDGLYLGPKILGDSTGLRPIWIIFAITFGGAVAGVIGMFLGVPIVAVIAFLIGRWVDSRLNDKELVEASEIMESNTNTSV